jgi:hypothetical protein
MEPEPIGFDSSCGNCSAFCQLRDVEETEKIEWLACRA